MGEGKTSIFTVRSKSEEGVVAAGWYIWDGTRKSHTDNLGKGATVWGGEVSAIKGGLESTKGKKVLILSDSQAAIKAIRPDKQGGREQGS